MKEKVDDTIRGGTLNDDACPSQLLSQWSSVGTGHTAAGVDGHERERDIRWLAGSADGVPNGTYTLSPPRRHRGGLPRRPRRPPQTRWPPAHSTRRGAGGARRARKRRGACGSAVGEVGGGGGGAPAARTNAARLQAAAVATPPPLSAPAGGGGASQTDWATPDPRCDVIGGGGTAGSAEKALWRRPAAARLPHENWGRPPRREAERVCGWPGGSPEEQRTVIG